jgi:hypothetical protein
MADTHSAHCSHEAPYGATNIVLSPAMYAPSITRPEGQPLAANYPIVRRMILEVYIFGLTYTLMKHFSTTQGYSIDGERFARGFHRTS